MLQFGCLFVCSATRVRDSLLAYPCDTAPAWLPLGKFCLSIYHAAQRLPGGLSANACWSIHHVTQRLPGGLSASACDGGPAEGLYGGAPCPAALGQPSLEGGRCGLGPIRQTPHGVCHPVRTWSTRDILIRQVWFARAAAVPGVPPDHKAIWYMAVAQCATFLITDFMSYAVEWKYNGLDFVHHWGKIKYFQLFVFAILPLLVGAVRCAALGF
jgi:hypothetical protein